QTGNITGVRQNQSDIEVRVPVQLTIAIKGKSDEVSGFERAEEMIQKIVMEALKPFNRLNANGVINVSFDNATPEAMGPSNDNVIFTRMNFTCFVILGV